VAFVIDPVQELTMLEAFDASGFPLPSRIPGWFGRSLPPSLAVVDLFSVSAKCYCIFFFFLHVQCRTMK
jgi:hypothetical protein